MALRCTAAQRQVLADVTNCMKGSAAVDTSRVAYQACAHRTEEKRPCRRRGGKGGRRVDQSHVSTASRPIPTAAQVVGPRPRGNEARAVDHQVVLSVFPGFDDQPQASGAIAGAPAQTAPCASWPSVEGEVAQALPGEVLAAEGFEDMDATVLDVASSVLQWSHVSSQQHLPSGDGLAQRLAGATVDREAILTWLVQACDIMHFQENILASTVLTLDRYCWVAQEQLSMDCIQKVLMAVLCVVLKVISVQDEICQSMPLRGLLRHLCREQVPLEQILQYEQRVLRALKFEVSTPSALEFLDTLFALLGFSRELAAGKP